MAQGKSTAAPPWMSKEMFLFKMFLNWSDNIESQKSPSNTYTCNNSEINTVSY